MSSLKIEIFFGGGLDVGNLVSIIGKEHRFDVASFRDGPGLALETAAELRELNGARLIFDNGLNSSEACLGATHFEFAQLHLILVLRLQLGEIGRKRSVAIGAAHNLRNLETVVAHNSCRSGLLGG